MRCDIDASEAVAHRSKGAQQVSTTARAPIDGVGVNLKPTPAKRTDGSRHVMGRSHQQPTFTRLGGRHCLAEDRIFDRIAGTVVDADSAARNPEFLEQPESEFRFAWPLREELSVSA